MADKCLRLLLTTCIWLSLAHSHLAAETFKNPLFVPTGSNPATLNQGDFNQDGIPDLVYIDGSGLHVLLGNGNGSFQAGQTVTLPLGMGGAITVADVNGDGKLDLLVGGITPQAQIGVLLGKGDGTFNSLVVNTLPLTLNLFAVISYPIGVADVNGDGAPDLIVPDTQNDQVYILLGNKSATFTLGSVLGDYSSPRAVWTGDFNNDGKKDFLVFGGLGADVQVFLGKGDGTFQPAVVYGPNIGLDISSVVLADVDGDGQEDMVVTTQTNALEILHGNADGTFILATGGTTLNSFGTVVTVADFNSDGIPDIAVNDASGLSLLLGTGNLNYAKPVAYGLSTGFANTSWALADFNLDHHLDFALCASGGIVLLRGNGNGTLQSYDIYDVGQAVSYIASGQFNGDKVPDIVVAEGSSGPGILLGKGDGTFTLEANTSLSGGSGTIALTGDFNGDGKTDLYFTTINSSGIVLFGTGNGAFGPPVSLTQFQQIGFVAASAGDFNNDGRTDLVSMNYQSYDVLLGQANESFTLFTGSMPFLNASSSPAVGDFNKDGRLDMVVGQLASLQVLLGNGDGTFTLGRNINTQLPGHDNICEPVSIATGDLDSDGNLDLVTTISCTGVAEILYGKGDGTFEDPVVLSLEQPYEGVSIADFNGDHQPDLIFWGPSAIGVIHNAGNRTYSGESQYQPGTNGNVVVQDFNGDGYPDIAVVGPGSTVVVLLNQPSGNLTTGSLTVQPEPSAITKPFTMTLNIAPFKAGIGTPTGNVTFSVDGNPVATSALAALTATATYQSSTLGLGAHTISAAYNGDANFDPAYFTVQHQIIPILYPTSITLSASPTTLLASQTVSLRAKVSSAGQTPYGTVSFLDGATPLGAVQLDATSTAVFDTALLAPGMHKITAYFVGNQNFAAVTSSPVTITVTANQTTTTLTANPSTVAVRSPVVLTASVTSSAGTPSGSVIFYDGTTLLQNVALDATGVAVLGTTFSTSGTHSISASYLSNATFGSSNSAPTTVTVTASGTSHATSTSISVSESAQTVRGYVLTAAVKGLQSGSNGSVIFFDGEVALSTNSLDENGGAIYSTASLSAGVHYISAYFPGNTSSGASVSRVLVQNIPQGAPDFAIIPATSSVFLSGASVSEQINVSGINGFTQDVSLACTAPIQGIVCSFQPAIMSAGSGPSTLTFSRQVERGTSLSADSFYLPAEFGAALLLLVSALRKRRTVVVLSAVLFLIICSGCGSSLSSVATPTNEDGIATITATSQRESKKIIHTCSIRVQISPNR